KRPTVPGEDDELSGPLWAGRPAPMARSRAPLRRRGERQVTQRGELQIGGITAKPGSVARGYVPYAKRVDGSSIGIPVVVVHGVEDGPVLTVDASCHGDEHEGTMAVLRLVADLNPTQMRGSLVAVPMLNVPAVEAMQRGNPFDHWNSDLNRLFPGVEDGNLTQRAAYT